MTMDPLSSMKLIEEVKKRPCLYDFRMPEYTHKLRVDAAWQEVADALGVKDSYKCKQKWKNLRSVFTRNVKKLSNGKQYRPYYLMKEMEFTLPFLRTAHLRNEVEGDPSEGGDNESNTSVTVEEELGLEMNDYRPFMQFAEPEDLLQETISLKSDDENSRLKNDDAQIRSNTPSLTENNSPMIDVEVNDHRKMFLLSLQSDVNEMTPEQMRRFKVGVAKLFIDILDKDPLEN